jgi:transposase
MIKTIRIPVAECLSHTKSDFYKALRQSLDASRTVANISATECLRQDDLTQDKCPKLYTYPRCKSLYSGVSFMVANVCRNTESLYKQSRWRMIRGLEASRSYRSTPWPLLRNKSIVTLKINDEGECLTCEIKLLDGWYKVRLRGGSNYRDQIKGLKRAIDGDLIGDSKIWIKDNIATLGICCDFPKEERKKKGGTVTVASGVDYLVGMMFERSQVPWVINADDVIAWKAESDRRNQRWRQARKQGVNKRRLRVESRRFAEKMQNRLKSKIHEISSKIVGKASRSGVDTIVLDFTVKSYISSFPWYDLATKIKYKAELADIKVVEKTQTVMEPDNDSPHIYFAYDPHSNRVKIGRTQGGKGRLKTFATTNPDWVLLAVENLPQNRLVQREKYWHGYFDNHRAVDRNKSGQELFSAEPVIAWLRAADWLGNTGNFSQIIQVLDLSEDFPKIIGRLSEDKSRVGHLQADSENLISITS